MRHSPTPLLAVADHEQRTTMFDKTAPLPVLLMECWKRIIMSWTFPVAPCA